MSSWALLSFASRRTGAVRTHFGKRMKSKSSPANSSRCGESARATCFALATRTALPPTATGECFDFRLRPFPLYSILKVKVEGN